MLESKPSGTGGTVRTLLCKITCMKNGSLVVGAEPFLQLIHHEYAQAKVLATKPKSV